MGGCQSVDVEEVEDIPLTCPFDGYGVIDIHSTFPLDCLGVIVSFLSDSRGDVIVHLTAVCKAFYYHINEIRPRTFGQRFRFQILSDVQLHFAKKYVFDFEVDNSKTYKNLFTMAEFRLFPNVERVKLNYSEQFAGTFLHFLPNLVSLELLDCVAFRNSGFHHVKSQLTELIIDHTRQKSNCRLTDAIFQHVPNLSFLCLAYVRNFRAQGFKHLQKLKTLQLFSTQGLGQKLLCHVEKTLEKLELFQCDGQWNCKFLSKQLCEKKMPQLRKLWIEELPNIRRSSNLEIDRDRIMFRFKGPKSPSRHMKRGKVAFVPRMLMYERTIFDLIEHFGKMEKQEEKEKGDRYDRYVYWLKEIGLKGIERKNIVPHHQEEGRHHTYVRQIFHDSRGMSIRFKVFYGATWNGEEVHVISVSTMQQFLDVERSAERSIGSHFCNFGYFLLHEVREMQELVCQENNPYVCECLGVIDDVCERAELEFVFRGRKRANLDCFLGQQEGEKVNEKLKEWREEIFHWKEGEGKGKGMLYELLENVCEGMKILYGEKGVKGGKKKGCKLLFYGLWLDKVFLEETFWKKKEEENNMITKESICSVQLLPLSWCMYFNVPGMKKKKKTKKNKFAKLEMEELIRATIENSGSGGNYLTTTPESKERNEVGCKSDVYNFGLIVFELLFNERDRVTLCSNQNVVYSNEKYVRRQEFLSSLLEKKKREERKILLEQYANPETIKKMNEEGREERKWWKLMSDCLSYNCDERPNFEEISKIMKVM